MSAAGPALPAAFQGLVDDLTALEKQDRLQLLLELSRELPALPDRLADHPELLEPVPECQSPIFLHVDVAGTGPDAGVELHFSAPPEAPTTRGFAAILAEGLAGLSAAEGARVPADVTTRQGLAEVVSPLRLNGMAGMLARVQRQVREKAELPRG